MAVLVDDRTSGILALLDPDADPVSPGRGERVPRGLLGARGLVAAGRTVDTDWRWAHSLHVTHLAGGDAARRVDYRVECLRDTGHLSTRLVHAVQDGAVLATMTASFQVPLQSRGPTHQQVVAVEWPDPHTLPAAAPGAALDVRHVDRDPRTPAVSRMWLRFTEEIPDRILLHAAAVVHASDLLLAEPLRGSGRADLRAEPLDLSVRFHRGFRADDWLRHEHESPTAADHRVLASGRFFSSMGRLVASVSQESAYLPVAGTTVGPASGPRKE